MSLIQIRMPKANWPLWGKTWTPRLTLLLLLMLLLLGCSAAEEPTATPAPSPVPSATATATDTPTPTPVPTNTSTPTMTPTPGPLTSIEVLDVVSPSMAFIELPTQTGSGFLFGKGYIITNAHVVYPFEKARVVFPDGAEFVDVPVLNVDTYRDLAVLGPIETEIESLPFHEEDLQIVGQDVYLIGYPGEIDEFPQPTIARGLISRIREWEPGEMTYYQVDARFGHGQSGGVLVSDRAEIVGVANFLFDASGYGLVASSKDIKGNLDRLIESSSDFAEDKRRVQMDGGQKKHSYVSLYDDVGAKTFVINEPPNTKVELDVDGGDNDLGFYITNGLGEFVGWVDENYSGIERYSFTTEFDTPYFVNVIQFSPEAHQFNIESNRNLLPYVDLDDNRSLLSSDSTDGCIDYPGDIDIFNLSLERGEWVNIMVDSVMIDPHLKFGFFDNFLEDDDSGGGVFGLNAELSYITSGAATFKVLVSDSWGVNTGCYTLNFRENYDGAPTPVFFEPAVRTYNTEFGDMWSFESEYSPFSMSVPAGWDESLRSFGEMAALCDVAELCLAGDALLFVTVEDLGLLGGISQEEYIAAQRSMAEGANWRIAGEQPFETRTGLLGTILEISFGELFSIYRFVLLHEGLGFNAAYIIQPGQEEELRPLMEYTFSTISVTK